MRAKMLMASAAAIAVVVSLVPSAATAAQNLLAALLGSGGGGGYIVVLKDNASPRTTDDVVRGAGAKVRHRYSTALKGFSASLNPDQLQAVRRHPAVAYVTHDGLARAGRPVAMSSSPTLTPPQSPVPSWGLDRIDQHFLPLNSRYWWLTTGRTVRTYVVDTGVRATSPDISGRVLSGYDFVDNDTNPDDCNGLGTGVSTIIAGRSYGVAKESWIVPVRVLNCSGAGLWSGIIAGLDWVAGHVVRPASVMMSLNGPANTAVDAAVERLLTSGIAVTTAAGVNNTDVCAVSPARVPGALTVGASDRNDNRASFSNYGACLDLFSPGVQVTTIWNTGSPYTLSGTSVATAHVAGVVALYLQSYPTATSQQVHDAVNRNATTGVVVNPGAGSPNRLVFSLLS